MLFPEPLADNRRIFARLDGKGYMVKRRYDSVVQMVFLRHAVRVNHARLLNKIDLSKVFAQAWRIYMENARRSSTQMQTVLLEGCVRDKKKEHEGAVSNIQ